MLLTGAFLACITAATADWTGNINYGSPSHNHNLGISLPKVKKRHEATEKQYMDASTLNFTHGVASGDPYESSIILWTRISPTQDNDASNITVSGTVPLYNHDTKQYVEASKNPICVEWVASCNQDLSNPTSQGKAYTSSDIDYTVKVEAGGLEPYTTYYYQFTVCGSEVKSPIGRTKTAVSVGKLKA